MKKRDEAGRIGRKNGKDEKIDGRKERLKEVSIWGLSNGF
jgi:hypothetical protein